MDKQDIAPALLGRIRADFLRLLRNAAPSAATYPAALDYADLVGGALAEAFRLHLSADTLPDGRMYWNIADRVLRPLLEEDHALVADAAAAVQQQLNEAAGLRLLAQRVPVDEGRIDGILNKVCAAEHYEDVAYMLDEPVRTFSRMAVDDTLKANVQFQGRAGLHPRVVRRTTGSCCEWCSRLAGSYDYPHVPADVYRRHERCRCKVEYDPGDGRRQNVWDKKWTEDEEALQARKEFAETPLATKIRLPKEDSLQNVLPEYLRTAAPGVGSISYDAGYDMVRHADEVKTAQWLHDHLGGGIVLLNEAHEVGQKMPDYLWRGSLWDLKTSSSEKSANSAIRHGLSQIQENPGGIILNFNQNAFSMQRLREVIRKRMQWYSLTNDIDILVLSEDRLVAALRYKKDGPLP